MLKKLKNELPWKPLLWAWEWIGMSCVRLCHDVTVVHHSLPWQHNLGHVAYQGNQNSYH